MISKEGELQKVAVITGGTSGIGLAAAKEFEKEGYCVFIIARGKKQVPRAWRNNFFRCDVSNYGKVKQTLSKIYAKHKSIDVVVNAGGIFDYTPFEELSIETTNKIIGTNFLGAVNVCKAVTPYMIKKGRGNIVNVASLSAYSEIPNTAIYSASKAALRSFSNALRMELKRYGIIVSVVSPGYTDTSLFDGKFASVKPIFYRKVKPRSPDVAAKAILMTVKNNKREVVVGLPERIVVKTALIFPGLVYKIVEKLHAKDKLTERD